MRLFIHFEIGLNALIWDLCRIIFAMCSAHFYLRAWIHRAKFVLRELLLRIIYVFLNKNFSRNNNFSVSCCIIILSLITLTQNTILRQRHQVEFNTSHINTRIASVNVGKFYRIFTFRFSFWALFDMQQMNFIWKYVFLIIPDSHSKLTSQRVTKVLFLLWKFTVV